jgi:hypothetical protein
VLSWAQWSSNSPSNMVLEIPDVPVCQTGQSSFAASRNWPLSQFCSLPSCPGPCPTPHQPALDLSPHLFLLHHWLKIHPSALPCSDHLQKPQQQTLISIPTTCVVDQELLSSSGNRMVRFGIPDSSIFLAGASSIFRKPDAPV